MIKPNRTISLLRSQKREDLLGEIRSETPDLTGGQENIALQKKLQQSGAGGVKRDVGQNTPETIEDEPTPIEQKIDQVTQAEDPFKNVLLGQENAASDADATLKGNYLKTAWDQAHATAEQTVAQPIKASIAAEQGVRGGFTGAKEGLKASIQGAAGYAASKDPRVLNAANDIRVAAGNLEAARKNIGTISQAQAFAEYDKAVAVEAAVNSQLEAEQATAKANLDFVTKNPASLAGASLESVQQMLSSAGINTAFAPGLVAQAQQAQNLKGIEQQQAFVDLQTSIAEMGQIGAVDPTTSMQDFGFYQSLLKSNPEMAEKFATMKNITESPLDIKIKQATLNYKNATTATERAKAQQALSDLSEYGSYSETNVDVVGVLGGLSKSMTKEQAYEAAGITRTGGQEFFGECAAFTNDMLGEPSKYGSSYESKNKHRNSDIPTIGSVFISNLGDNGHCGFVEDIDYEAGTATLYDMNRHGKQMANRRTVPIDSLATTEGITGYENLALTSKKNAGNDEGLYNKFLQTAEDEGLSGEKAVAFAEKRLDEAYKTPTEAQGKAYKALVVAKNQNELFNNIVADIDPEDFANAINVITKKIGDPEATITGEIVNRNVSDPKIRQAIMSSLRWTAAVLREESGAAISVNEYLTKGMQFFPTAGDDEETIKQKSDARLLEETGLKGKIGASGERQLLEAEKKPETRAEKLARYEEESKSSVSDEEGDELEGL